jgi:hypothetical protein
VDHDLIDLLSAWQGEELDPNRREQLVERLRSDAAFQESFIDEIRMLGTIKVVQATEPRWLRLQDELGWGSAKRPAESDLEDALMRRIDSLPRRRWPGLRSLGVGAAAVLAVAALGVLSRPKKPEPASRPVAVARSAEVRPVGGLAMVVKLDAVRWDRDQKLVPVEGSILAPGRFRLQSGRVSLSYLSGVTLTLEGPADLELITIDRVFCRRGRLRARVPAGAEGFVVASPASAVVDMGTEFAMNVEPDGTARVMVFEGSAEAALLDATGSPTCTRLVEAREAFELDPHTGKIAESLARPDGFVAAAEAVVPSLVLDAGYAAAVMNARPRGYWRFEALGDGGIVPNEVAGGAPLRVHGPISGTGESQGNGCAVFSAAEDPQFLSTDGLWELAQAPGHAVELWFLPEGISHVSLVGLFPPKDHLPLGRHGRHVHTFLLELTAWDRRSLYKPAAIRFLHRWPLDTRIGSNILSEETYRPGRWHHVVAQKNREKMELYFDGSLVHPLVLEPDHPTVACRLVVGRRTPDPLELYDSRNFVGRLDELALYDRPLSAEEVRSHFLMASEKPDGD